MFVFSLSIPRNFVSHFPPALRVNIIYPFSEQCNPCLCFISLCFNTHPWIDLIHFDGPLPTNINFVHGFCVVEGMGVKYMGMIILGFGLFRWFLENKSICWFHSQECTKIYLLGLGGLVLVLKRSPPLQWIINTLLNPFHCGFEY